MMSRSQKPHIELTVFLNFTSRASRAGRDILKRTMDKLGSDAILTYRFFPSPSQREESDIAAKAVLAAEKQGHFRSMYDLLFKHSNDYCEEDIMRMARNLELDMEKFNQDFQSQEIQKRLEEDYHTARKAGIVLTPALTIDGILYKGAWDENALLEAIEKRGGRHVEIVIESFFAWGASAAFILLIATIGALVYVNVGFYEAYEHLRESEFGFILGRSNFQLPLEVWVNDALMAIFFLLIGLEMKREVLYGELSDMSRAAMPVICAIGGMLVPALIYYAINVGGEGAHGWGVSMATDIAFTLGLMALLGKRVPLSLKVFISALAVADDLGAIVVIALFYGHGFHIEPFLAAIAIIGILFAMNYFKVYNISFYLILGIVLWYFIYASGIHATLAGFIVAILIPSRRSGDLVGVATQAAFIFDEEIAYANQNGHEPRGIRYGSLRILTRAIERLREPAYYLEHGLEKWVNYLILPLFAFFNIGILIGGTEWHFSDPINLGIMLGLCLGKPLGIAGACWIASKTGLARLSAEINWGQVLGAGCLAGVGFTMSIVVASTAFTGEDLDSAKLSILIASTVSAIAGLAILYQAGSHSK